MRRKKKFNIYTNATLRKDCHYLHCDSCKGICKVQYECKIDENSISKHHID